MGNINVIELLYAQKDRDLIYNALPRTLEPGYRFGPHCHENVELCLMQEGECDIIVNGETVTVHAGELMVIFSHMIHTFHVSAPHQARFLQTHFRPEGLLSVSPEVEKGLKFIAYMLDSTNAYLLQPSTPELLSCVERICREFATDSGEYRMSLANLYIDELVFLLSDELNQSYRRVFMSITSPIAIQAIHYINSNMARRITLSDVARHCSVSTRYLAKVFREQVNFTVNDYINISKIDTAMGYLSAGKVNMSEIAPKLGYASSQYFATVFKKYTGVTPREFRARSDKDI